MGSRDMNLVMMFYSEADLQFRENRMQSLLEQIEILSNACVFNLEFMEMSLGKSPN